MPENCIPEYSAADRAQKYARACADVLERNGVRVGDCLGCGAEGCVFLLEDGSAVIKFTDERSEAELSAFLANVEKPHPGVPLIYGVFKVDNECTDGRKIYAIVREDLESLSEHDLEATRYMMSEMRYAADVYSHVQNSLFLRDEAVEDNDEFKVEYFDGIAKQNEAKFWSALAEIERNTPKAYHWVLDQMLDIYAWLDANDLVMTDLHFENLGIRKGKGGKRQIVIRDLGYGRARHGRFPGFPAEHIDKLQERRDRR
jgi:hypothetical protein